VMTPFAVVAWWRSGEVGVLEPDANQSA
jgi:hypothetical protein